MNSPSFTIGDEVYVAEREGVWIIAEMVQEGDGISTERPYWLRPEGRWTGWIRASVTDLTLRDCE